MKAMERFGSAAICPGLVLGLWLLYTAAGQAQAPPNILVVADVLPVGNRYVPAQTIKNTIKTRAGVEYNQHVVSDDIRRLMETRQFEDVRVEYKTTADNRVLVYFVVKEFP